MIALVLSTILLALALLHILWGIGFWWPIREETALARAATGFRGVTRMPGAVPCAVVAVALITAAWWPHSWPATGALYLPGLGALAALFGGRGLAAWLPGWRRLTPEEPFATYDRRYYGPLCLFIAALFVLILIRGTP